jgi:cobalamin biosynthesis protein CobT
VIKATAYKELKTMNGSNVNVDTFLNKHHDTTIDAILQYIEKTNKELRTDLITFRKLINTKITFNKVVNVINTDKIMSVRESKLTRVLNLDLNCDLLTATEKPTTAKATKAKTVKGKTTKAKVTSTKATTKPKRVTRKKSTKNNAIVKPITAANDDFSEDDFGNSRIDQHIPKEEAKKIQASVGKHIKGKYGSGNNDPLNEDIADYVSDVGNVNDSDNESDNEPEDESNDGYEYGAYNNYADEHDTSNETNEADDQPEDDNSEESEDNDAEEPDDDPEELDESEEPEEPEESEDEPDEPEDDADPDEELVEHIADDISKYMDKWNVRTKIGKEELSNLYDEIQSNMEAVLDTHNADLIEQLHNTLDEVYKSLPANVKRTKAAAKRKFISILKEYIKKTA